MIDIYGIPNCDTVQKALKWMDKHGIDYTFHNYRENPPTKKLLNTWFKYLPADKLINRKSTTYRELSLAEKEELNDKDTAISIMISRPSIIKRPVWHFGGTDYLLGWDEKQLTTRLLPEGN